MKNKKVFIVSAVRCENCALVRHQQCVWKLNVLKLHRSELPGFCCSQNVELWVLGWWFCCAAEIRRGSLISFPSAATQAVGCFVSLAVQVNGRTESSVETLKGIQKSK